MAVALPMVKLLDGPGHTNALRPSTERPSGFTSALALHFFPAEDMVSNKNVRVVPHGDKWHVIRQGTDQPSSQHDDQEEAIAAGTAEAKQDKVELLVVTATRTVMQAAASARGRTKAGQMRLGLGQPSTTSSQRSVDAALRCEQIVSCSGRRPSWYCCRTSCSQTAQCGPQG